METVDLVQASKNGDKEALIRLVMVKRDEYYRLAYAYMGNKQDALDSMQEMILLVFENIRKLKDPEAFYSWSKTILVNCCRSLLRKRGRVVSFINYEQEYLEKYPQKEIRHDIMLGLKRLNGSQQEAIRLKYFLDLDYTTIAKITGVPEGTVKSRIFNSLAKMREILGGDY